MKKLLAAGLLALSGLTAANAATVTNGNFETGFANTNYSLGAGYMNNTSVGTNAYGYTTSGDGNYAGYMTGLSSITFQLADLTPNAAYTVNFSDALSGLVTTASNTFTVSYGSTVIGTFAANSTNWANAATSAFTATGTTGTLTFTGTTANTFGTTRTVGVDNITLSAAVPEPATWAMMIGGFGMIGGMMRRTRPLTKLA